MVACTTDSESIKSNNMEEAADRISTSNFEVGLAIKRKGNNSSYKQLNLHKML